MTVGSWVLGLLNGLTIGLLAVGLVLIYKSNRFLNLAYAQLGAVPALLLAKWVLDWHWNWWLAFLAALAVGTLTSLGVERFLIRRLENKSRSPLRLLLLSLGISQLLLALTYIPSLGPDTSKSPTYPQPFASDVRVGGVVLTGMEVLTALMVPALVIALAVFMRYSITGKQIRAAANNPDAARLCGIKINRVAAITWATAGALATVSGVLQAPGQASFNYASFGPYLLMLTLGAAAAGAFVSLPLAMIGGIGLGLVDELVSAQTSSASDGELAVFVVIMAIVFLRGGAIAKVFELTGSVVDDPRPTLVPAVLKSDPFVRYHHTGVVLLSATALVVWPLLPYFNTTGHVFLLSLILIYAILGISLTILLGWGGQVSLGQFAVVGLGAYLTARWQTHGVTLPMLCLVVGLVGAAVLVLVGLPALRVRGLTLAVTTLGFAVIGSDWLFHQGWVASSQPFGLNVTSPSLGSGLGSPSSQRAAYYAALVVLAFAVATSFALRRSGQGRIIIAVRDNERASAAFGITPATVKLAVLALSGFLAGVAGVLWADSWKSVAPTQFGADVSIALIAIPVIGGLGSVGGAVGASVALYAGTFFLGPHVDRLFGSFGNNLGFLLFVGGLTQVTTVLSQPSGLSGLMQQRWQDQLDRRAAKRIAQIGSVSEPEPSSLGAELVSPLDAATSITVPPRIYGLRHRTLPVNIDGQVALHVTDVVVRFGGIVALNSPEITVGAGEIVGLIGTNGAGKTTLMNVISGHLKPSSGSVRLFGHEVADFPADMRAGFGLARSFQDASLFRGLSVMETVQVPMSHRLKVGMVPAMLGAPWVRDTDHMTHRGAEGLVARFGLAPWADTRAGELSTGTRRICDLAAQVAARPKLLLLDEPTAGVAQREAEAFGPLLRRIRDELDCAILIVEHDMPLLMGLCDRIYALEGGAVIAEGTAEQIRSNPRVIASYLGGDEAAITRSGTTATEPPSGKKTT